jgi:hypothetical protein
VLAFCFGDRFVCLSDFFFQGNCVAQFAFAFMLQFCRRESVDCAPRRCLAALATLMGVSSPDSETASFIQIAVVSNDGAMKFLN